MAPSSSFLYSQTTTSAARRRRFILSACLLQAGNPPHATLEVEVREFVVQNGVRNRSAEEVFGAFTAGLSSDRGKSARSTYFSNAVNLWREGGRVGEGFLSWVCITSLVNGFHILGLTQHITFDITPTQTPCLARGPPHVV